NGTDEGKARVRARIVAKEGVTPLGLLPSPDYAERHQRLAFRPGAFGRTRELLCPFHHDGKCTIWQHRGVTCASFFCKFDRGALGHGFWNLVVIAFNVVDRALGRWLLEQKQLDAAACDALLFAPRDEASYSRAWGAYLGREEDYFVEAALL